MNPKILIVDDESPIRTSLASLIHHYLDNHFTIQEAAGVEDGWQKINANPPEILFLDIEMEDGTVVDASIEQEPVSDEFYYIVPAKCTECNGFHEEPQCAAVCPVDCCVDDPDYVETEEELLAKKAWMHA